MRKREKQTEPIDIHFDRSSPHPVVRNPRCRLKPRLQALTLWTTLPPCWGIAAMGFGYGLWLILGEFVDDMWLILVDLWLIVVDILLIVKL
uniref:Uncharacterized protein n=1 Tax=Fagus sylvatica TaxID=28930 RepID=A0A2N9ESL8_FAGSY